MNYENNQNNAMTAMNTNGQFLLPTMTEGEFSKEELADDMEGMQLTFQKVKIPGGGALQFELPT